jgi:hypothetical protein
MRTSIACLNCRQLEITTISVIPVMWITGGPSPNGSETSALEREGGLPTKTGRIWRHLKCPPWKWSPGYRSEMKSGLFTLLQRNAAGDRAGCNALCSIVSRADLAHSAFHVDFFALSAPHFVLSRGRLCAVEEADMSRKIRNTW